MLYLMMHCQTKLEPVRTGHSMMQSNLKKDIRVMLMHIRLLSLGMIVVGTARYLKAMSLRHCLRKVQLVHRGQTLLVTYLKKGSRRVQMKEGWQGMTPCQGRQMKDGGRPTWCNE